MSLSFRIDFVSVSYITEAMVAHTVLLDFTVSSSVIADMEKRSGLKSAIANVLAEHFTGLKPLTESNIDGSLLVLYTGPRGSLITVRGYTEGLITLNIEYYKQDDQEALLTFEVRNCTHLTNNLLRTTKNIYCNEERMLVLLRNTIHSSRQGFIIISKSLFRNIKKINIGTYRFFSERKKK